MDSKAMSDPANAPQPRLQRQPARCLKCRSHLLSVRVWDVAEWARELGDRRRTKRTVKYAAQVAGHPDGSSTLDILWASHRPERGASRHVCHGFKNGRNRAAQTTNCLASHGRVVCRFEGWASASNLAGGGIATANGVGVESSPAIRRQYTCSAISFACHPSSPIASS